MTLQDFLRYKLINLPETQFNSLISRLEGKHDNLENKTKPLNGTREDWAINLIKFIEVAPDGLNELYSAQELSLNLPCKCVENLCRLIKNFKLDRCPDILESAVDNYLENFEVTTDDIFKQPDYARIWEGVFCRFLDSAILKSRGQYHLIHFVNFLAGGLEEHFCRKKLRRWVDETCKSVGINVPPGADRTGREDSRDRQRRYLLIALSKRGGYFTVMGWLTEADGCLMKVLDKKSGFSLADFPDYLAEVLTCDKFVGALRKCQHLVLELILPVDLLNDGLEIAIPRDQELPVGAQYGVILRPLERLSDRKWIADWIPNWTNNWHTFSESMDGSHIVSLKRRDMPPDCDEYFRKGQWLFLLGFAPDLDDFKDMFNGGVGIMLWPRTAPYRKLSKTEAEIASMAIEELPIWLKRKRASEWRRSKGKSITPLSLLWDDPFRCPDDITTINHPDY